MSLVPDVDQLLRDAAEFNKQQSNLTPKRNADRVKAFEEKVIFYTGAFQGSICVKATEAARQGRTEAFLYSFVDEEKGEMAAVLAAWDKLREDPQYKRYTFDFSKHPFRYSEDTPEYDQYLFSISWK